MTATGSTRTGATAAAHRTAPGGALQARGVALAVRNLSVAYGNVVAVHDATFTVAEGDACAIIGPNGNGKSSILMGVTGMIRRRGAVEIFGAQAKNGDVRWAARHGLTLVPERRQLYPDLSTADNILLGCYTWTRSIGKARRSGPFARAIELFPELNLHLKQLAGTLSGGQQQMVAIARGLAADPKILAVDEPCLGLAEAVAKRVYDALSKIHEQGTTLIIVEEAPEAGAHPVQPAGRGAQRRGGRQRGRCGMMKFGNLLIAGITTGAIYAMFAVCVSVWYRVSNILNLAVGDFAMVGALGVDNLYRVKGLPLPVAIISTLLVVAAFAYVYDQVVLRIAQDGPRRMDGIVVTFFFTFALSFFIDGVAKMLFGTDVHAAPALWNGNSLSLGSLHFERAGLLVLACAVIIGGAFWVYIRFTLGGKALEASGENSVGARIVGIDTRRYRRLIFVATAVIAAVFGIVESPITGFTYLSGATISLTGFLAAAYGGFRKPGRALLAGLFIGVLEAMLGGYVSAEYGDTVLYAILAAMVLAWPRQLGFESAVSG